jgi:glyoxylase-like metal-dependent hydrolase (beta-lactamase superfamily II)
MSDLAAARQTPPRPNELELSLFGPGIGESLVIHLGNGDWVVVDSCLDEQRQAVALGYLESLGVDVAAQVKLVLVTHWHDDHIRGMSQVVAAARTAEFACSAALDGQEFLNLVAARKEVSLVGQTSGVEEFESILDILAGRTSGRYPRGPGHWAASGMCHDGAR